ncbi:MAG: sn-glycerol-1-phosphate dehydrogenase [Pseudomonadota bacterium]
MSSLSKIITPAVARSDAIAEIVLGNGVISEAAALMGRHFGDTAVCVVCDENTRVAGAALFEVLAAAGITARAHVLPATPRPKPSVELGDEIAAAIGEAVPVALGSGVINDVTKYAAFTLGRPYLCVATAASMDGYSSAGAPLSNKGFKKTVPCRAPLAILADLDVVAAAPAEMSGWGYGDLAGKVPSGGDWIIADALGIEAIDNVAWPLVQDNLAGWLAAPDAVRAGEASAIADLFAGLTLSGLAMEFHGSSRPASGAEHQIAHMWEMEGLMQDGERVSHGACVSVGTMASLSLHDFIAGQDLSALDVDRVVAAAPSMARKREMIAATLPPALAEKAVAETEAKHAEGDALRARLVRLRDVWPALKARLTGHMLRAPQMAALLARAGAPVVPADIGIGDDRLRDTILAARFIRSRYTVLDLIEECGLLEAALDGALPVKRG